MLQTIIVLGTNSSGSGAVADYLSSRKDILNPFNDNEFRITCDPNGLHHLFNNFYTCEDLLYPSSAVEEFRKYITNIQRFKIYSNYKKKKITLYNKKIIFLTNNFINDISKISYFGLPHYKQLTLDSSQELMLRFKRKFLKKNIPSMKMLKIITPIEKDIFIKISRKYINDILQSNCKIKLKNRKIILNNSGNICDPIHSTQYYTNRKIICVTRDPRDIFNGMKTRQAKATPWYDVKIFVNWYKYYFGNKKFLNKLKNNLILRIKYENFLNNFELENRKICQFLKISTKYKVSPKKRGLFDISLSRKNLYKSKKNLTSFEYNYIEKKLKDYLQW